MSFAKILKRMINAGVRCLFYAVQIVVTLKTAFTPLRKKRSIPPVDDSLLLLRAGELAEKIRTRKITCVQVVEAYIGRIKQVEPFINSVVQERFEEARKEAAEVDEMVASRPDDGYWKRNRPLLGVPLTVKESIAVQGMSNTSGMGNGKVAERDAVCVANLRCLGAIVLAVTNVPQMCSFWETSNPAFGTTNNPYDTRRTAGGSSGGEGALLGSAGSVIGIGSDLGGSLRLPANFCGVFAHKPTPGLVSVDGHTPTCSDPRWPFYFCLGPMARYSEDLPLVLECMILTKDRPHALNLHEWADMRHLNIFYMEGEGPKSVLPDTITTEVKDTLIKAVKYLKMEHNCKLKKIIIKGIQNCMNMGHLVFRLESIGNVYQMEGNSPDDCKSVALEFLKKMTFRSKLSLSALMYGPVKVVSDLMPQRTIKKMEDRKEKLRAEFNKLLGDSGVLLYPTFPWSAPYHNRMASQMLNASYTLLFNVMGLPVTQCPIGRDAKGLPIGIQIVAGQGQDMLCMTVARALEKGFGGWKEPLPT